MKLLLQLSLVSWAAIAAAPHHQPAIHQPATNFANRQPSQITPTIAHSSNDTAQRFKSDLPKLSGSISLKRNSPVGRGPVLIALADVAAADAAKPAANDRKPGDPVDPPPPPVLVLNISAPAAGESVGIGDMATITIDSKSTAQGIVWAIVPTPTNPNNWRPHVPSDPAHASPADYFADLCNGTAAGTFTVIASGNLNGQTVIAQQTVTFSAPTPPPPPTPTPTPTPTPVASKLWILTLDDHTTRTTATAELLSDGAFWQAVSAAGHRFREYDVTDPSIAPWKAAIPAGMSPPVVFYQDQATGKLLQVEPLPDSSDEVAAEIEKLTGKAIADQ